MEKAHYNIEPINQQALRKKRTRLYLNLTAVIILASSITGYIYYTQYYPKRHLRQAEAFKGMDLSLIHI